MIIVQLDGDLGNQMFQYAAAKALSIRQAETLKLYFKPKSRSSRHTYLLKHFNIQESFAAASELRKLKPAKGVRRFIKQLQAKDPNQFVYRETEDIVFESSFLNRKGDTYLIGKWQDISYFENYDFQIRKAFTPTHLPTGYCKELIEHMLRAQLSVSVHFMLGEQLNPYAILTKKQQALLDYYMKAAQEMIRKIGNPSFFVFTDSAAWVSKYFKPVYHTEVIDVEKLENDIDLLRLMMNGRHQIISDNALAWWGGWLNARKDKIVIQPQANAFQKL